MAFLEEITLLISILLAFALIGVLIKEYFEKRIRLMWLLIISIGLGALDRIISFLFQRGVESLRLVFIAVISFFVSMYVLYLFFDLFENPTPSPLPMAIYTFFLGFGVASVMIIISLLPFLPSNLLTSLTLFENPPNGIALEEFRFTLLLLGLNILFFSGSLIIFSLVMPIHVIVILNRIRTRFKQSEMQKAYRYMLIGFMIYLVGAYIGNIGVIARILEIIGQGLILYTFISNKSVLISAHRLDNLLIVNASGIVLFNYSFPTTKVQADELLLAGILSAITSSMEEITQSQESLQSIKLGDLHLTIRTLLGNTRVILISERVSRFIIEAMDRFVREFELQFKNELEDTRTGYISTKTYEKAQQIVERIFLIKGTTIPEFKPKNLLSRL